MTLARLFGVDLPRVQIEYRRCPELTIRPIEQPTGQRIGKEAEIATARRWHIDPAKANGSERHFNHPRGGDERGTRRAGAPIEIMFTRIYARAIKKSLF